MENYKLVLFPGVQEYMEEEWFTKEAILYQTINDEQDYESSAYFIPIKYITSVEEKMYTEIDNFFEDMLEEYSYELRDVSINLASFKDSWLKENL